jgi:N-acylneuraminate cytidylyltransferase/CMP-N,N'-diacetyllegionaminic acid synthase
MIAARGGSKGLPGKNVALLGGKPLIAWTIEAARHARVVTRTIVTTDDPQIARIAREHGAEVPFERPAHLAEDATPGIEPVLHAVRWLEEHEGYRPAIVVNLQATSPLRTAADVDAAVALLGPRDAESVVSVTPATDHPYWMKTVNKDGWMTDFVSQPAPTLVRQQLPPVYSLNGAIYISKREALLARRRWDGPETAPYIMPFERSVDIDTEWDLMLAELLMSRAGVKS